MDQIILLLLMHQELLNDNPCYYAHHTLKQYGVQGNNIQEIFHAIRFFDKMSAKDWSVLIEAQNVGRH